MTTRKRKPTALRLLAIELASRPCGCSSRHLQDAAGIDAKPASSALHNTHKRGETLPFEHPHDSKHRLHYFTTAAAGKAWQRGPVPIAPPRVVHETAPQGHSWRPDEAGPTRHTAGASKMAADAPSAPVTAPKITLGASPAFGIAARYYVDPATVRGPFTAVGVGRDVQTGKAWGAAA